MKRYESDWERELAASPFERNYFTEKHFRNVKYQIKSRQKQSSRHWLPISIVSAVIMASVVLLIFQPPKIQSMLDHVNTWFSNDRMMPDDLPVPKEEEPPQDKDPEQRNDSIQFKVSTFAFEQPDYWNFSGELFTVEAGQSYTLLKENPQFVQIQSGQITGWVPSWYVLQEEQGEQIQQVRPYEMIVDHPTAFYAYPEVDAPTLSELEQGKVVRVLRQYGDWLRVEIVTYAEPVIGEKWIRRFALKEYADQDAKEGYMRLTGGGSFIYTDPEGKGQGQHFDYRTTVRIDEEYEDTYLIAAAGGINGYIRKEDFIPNPFGLIRGTYLELTSAEEDALNRFILSRDDEDLRGLEPGQMFKIYYNARLIDDPGLTYDLLNQQDDGIPSRETYIQESLPYTELNFYNENGNIMYMSQFETKTEYNGDNALVKPVKDIEETGPWGFRLSKTDEGIWKVSWLPIQ